MSWRETGWREGYSRSCSDRTIFPAYPRKTEVPGVSFDTLKFVEKLETGGFTHDQAKAAAEAVAEATGEQLVTKLVLGAEFSPVKAELLLLKWIMDGRLQPCRDSGSILYAAETMIAGAAMTAPARPHFFFGMYTSVGVTASAFELMLRSN